MRNKDIFDYIMELPVLRTFNPFYQKFREQLLYLFFGGLAFIVSMVTYYLFCKVMDDVSANVPSWIITVLFAYYTNMKWVFIDKPQDAKETISQMGKFFTGRLSTLVLEEIILFVGIKVLSMGNMVTKAIGQIVVIVTNYFISKLLIFNK